MATTVRDGVVAGRRDGWWLLLIAYSALLVRGWVPYRTVFGGDAVRFQGNDAWYHLRRIDYLWANFPHPLGWDPYAFHPGGQTIEVAPLFDYLVVVAAGLLKVPASVLGLGSSSDLVEAVAAWMPPVLGTLCVLPVYAIGRRLFDYRVGLLAAALLAVQPGQFLLRSLLGFTDHHVLEVFASTLTVALMLAALDPAAPSPAGRPSPFGRPLGLWFPAWRRALVAGAALGAYLLSWGGGSLFVAILIAWLVAEVVAEHLGGRSSARLRRFVTIFAAAALATLLPFLAILPRARLHLAALGLLLLAPWLLEGVARIPALAGERGRYRFPLALAGLAGAGALALWLAAPSLAAELASNLRRFVPSPLSGTVAEAEPLLSEGGAFSLVPVWVQYRWTFVLAAVGLLILGRSAWRQPSPGRTLLLVWSLGMGLATLAQNRFGYYLAVNVSLLSALVCRALLAPLEGAAGRAGGRARLRGLATGVVALIAFLPAVEPSLKVAQQDLGPGPEWLAALHWLRHNTPEPMGDDSAYYRADREGDYGVLSWWDYGYWMTRIARRIPNANPTQNGATTVARFLAAGDASEAYRTLDEAGTRYVVLHAELTTWPDRSTPGRTYGKFDSILRWAGKDAREFYDLYWRADEDGTPTPVLFYYPAYYRSMAVRLFYYDGMPIEPRDSAWVISYREVEGAGGFYKQILSSHLFEDYEDAAAFLAAQTEGHWRLGGFDPLLPCVPVAAAGRLRKVYASAEAGISGPGFALPALKIFDYAGRSAAAESSP